MSVIVCVWFATFDLGSEYGGENKKEQIILKHISDTSSRTRLTNLDPKTGSKIVLLEKAYNTHHKTMDYWFIIHAVYEHSFVE